MCIGTKINYSQDTPSLRAGWRLETERPGYIDRKESPLTIPAGRTIYNRRLKRRPWPKWAKISFSVVKSRYFTNAHTRITICELNEYGVIVFLAKSPNKSCGAPRTRRISNCILRIDPVSAQHISGSLFTITASGRDPPLPERRKVDLNYV